MSRTDDIDAWRRAHLRLTFAIVQSHNNIAKELAIRRYLLEEITRCRALPVPAPKKVTSKGKNGAGSEASGGDGKPKKKTGSKPAKDEEPTTEKVGSKSSDVKKANNAKKVKEDGAKKVPHKKATSTKSKLGVPINADEMLFSNKVLSLPNVNVDARSDASGFGNTLRGD
ncbi:hypothetical protein ACHAWX_000354 [Stephanocyclus meneghinianus]